LNVDDTLPLHGSVELNNRQSPNTTPLRLTASAQYNDLWQLGHSVSVSYQIAPMRPQDAEVFSGSYLARLPGVDWLSFLVYGVDSNSDVAAIGGLNVVGPGQIVGARAVMTLPSAENFYQTLSLGPDYKRFGETVSQTGGSFSSPVTYYPLVANYTNKYQTDKYSAQLTASVTGNLRPVSSDPTDFDNRRFLASGSFVHLNIDTSHTQELLQGFQLYAGCKGSSPTGRWCRARAVRRGWSRYRARFALDSSVVKEMQRLNRLMVVLTIAISGGPFLGLLGTVVGVMITFAAIAASGDVNVNAIAPGIAAALVATVAGLGVAIPALFGYNYLISRIKNLSDDIQVFVDEFVTKMAEFCSADRPDPIEHRIAAE
jgi:hypothetical protein